MDLLETGASAPAQHPEVLTQHDPLKTLSNTARTLYAALVATAQAAAAARGYVASTTHVTVHIPLEVVALALGRHRTTIWRASNKLRELGLVDARPHKTTISLSELSLNEKQHERLVDERARQRARKKPAPGIGEETEGIVVNDGTLWCVRLDPDKGAPARLSFYDHKREKEYYGGPEREKHQWRDLARDRRRGRTAHRAVQERQAGKTQQSLSSTTEGFDLELLLEWALPPQHSETPLPMTVAPNPRADLEAVLDVQYAAREDRREAVDGAAHALAGGLADRGGLAFYRWLLWQCLKLQQSTGAAPWYTVYEQARRAQTDVREGFARGAKNDGSGGGLFISRLKASPWWDELVRASGRVGVMPPA